MTVAHPTGPTNVLHAPQLHTTQREFSLVVSSEDPHDLFGLVTLGPFSAIRNPMLPESAVEVGRAANVEFALFEAEEVGVHVGFKLYASMDARPIRTRG